MVQTDQRYKDGDISPQQHAYTWRAVTSAYLYTDEMFDGMRWYAIEVSEICAPLHLCCGIDVMLGRCMRCADIAYCVHR